MKILVNDHAGHPLHVQLSRALARLGHEVLHTYTAELQSPRGNLSRRSDDPPNFSCRGIILSKPFNRYGLVGRFLQEKELGRALQSQTREFRPDAIISANTPLIAQSALLAEARNIGAGFLFWLQDLLGLAISKSLESRLPLLGRAVGKYFIHLEQTLLAASDAVVAITEDFLPFLTHTRIRPETTHVIHNWGPLVEMPVCDKSNSWSRMHHLDNRFCFFYCGTLGMKHNPALLAQLALRFKGNENVRIVVITEGIGAEYLRSERESLGLDNLILLPFQPYEQLPMVLASADVLVALLEPSAGQFAVPSKVMTYLCARRPLVLAVPEENLASRIVARAAAGLVVSPSDTEGFLLASERLANDCSLREKLAANSYHYATGVFDIERIGEQFNEILKNMCSSTSRLAGQQSFVLLPGQTETQSAFHP